MKLNNKEKAKMITTATTQYPAGKNQWWEKTQSGKAWRLWQEDKMGLNLLKSIPQKRVFFVVPLE